MKKKILELLKSQPFVPFRIELSSGTVHEVRHPEQLMFAGALMFVGVPQGDQVGPDYVDVAIITLLHVAKVEILQSLQTTN